MTPVAAPEIGRMLSGCLRVLRATVVLGDGYGLVPPPVVLPRARHLHGASGRRVDTAEEIRTDRRQTNMEHEMLMEELHEGSVGRNQLPEGSPGGRRRRWTATTVAVALALVGAGLTLSAGGNDGGQGRVKVLADPAPSATTTVAPATTAPLAAAPDSAPATLAAAPDPAPPPPAATKPTTTVPRPPAAPDRSRPAGMTYIPEAIWPETLAELDELQAAVDQGQQPWRNDPVAVARAYLLDRGLPTPGMGPFEGSGAGAGSVNYTVAGKGGRVDLRRLLNASIWYVAGSRSAAIPGLQVSRRSGSLAVVVQGGADGTLAVRAKRPNLDWTGEQSVQLFAGGTRSLTVPTDPGSGQVILQMRLLGDGKAGLAEVFVGVGSEGVQYSALDSESRLRVDGLGPVRIGMDLEAAVATTGLAMSYREGPSCVGYTTTGPPAGVFLTSAEGSFKVDFISISEPTISTLSGIRVGSTLAEARRAYGDKLRGSVQDGWGKLVLRPEDASLNDVSLALLFSDGKVAGMWAGLRGVVEADEACA